MTTLTGTGIVFSREIRPQLRNPIGLVFGMLQPLVFLFLFGSLLSGVTAGSWQWFVPGILVMLALSSTTGIGWTLMTELSTGSMDRLLVTPLTRTSLLLGRMTKEVLTLVIQAALIIGIAIPLGFRLHLSGVLIGLLILVGFGLGLGALSMALAIASRKQQALFYSVQEFLLFPLLLTSGILLPLNTAPKWLTTVAHLNPLTYVVNAERALFAGEFTTSGAYGIVAATGTAVLGLALAARALPKASQ
ncbi:ABC-2 type transport system permease protein [Amycolatopsis xylanica]|uniref:Transport permease protein n=1 Tax=Amycolatopsis xylanica TaxID=589385 RepID=A0A1H3ET03_9PSEU|nr:ABC transporter permease [Amycolatopsis xylanica]SDX81886.1 ABC-2 type transport system permease protein [Amycolatopsis xylanica]